MTLMRMHFDSQSNLLFMFQIINTKSALQKLLLMPLYHLFPIGLDALSDTSTTCTSPRSSYYYYYYYYSNLSTWEADIQ
jgi:hypothetical protein